MTAATRLATSLTQYLGVEDHATERHAFHDGDVYAMAGGSTVHALLGARMARLLGNALEARPCDALGSDQRIHVDADNVTYADVVVLCPPVLRPENDRHGVTNPTAIVEVLSPSTEVWDRGGKFSLYQRIQGLAHYVLVAQDQWRIEHFRRQDDGSWRFTAHGPGDELDLDALGVRLRVDEVYAKVEAFGGPGRDARPSGPPR